MILPITLTMAAAATLLNIWMAVRCSVTRVKQKVMVGDGGDSLMLARMRAQANFVENAPFFLILLGLVELGDGSAHWLWWVGIAFILGRIIHVFGMERPAPNALRATSMFVTLATLIILAIAAIRLAYEAGQPVMLG